MAEATPVVATPDSATPDVARPPGRNPAIDGLRGFALLGMLAWHAEVTWMRGGFARMTIFFVLSGFLAAQSYNRVRAKQRSGAFRSFWMRRARRLLPTTLLGVALAIVVTVTVGTIDARRDLAGDVLATVGNVANWRFIAADRPYGALFERPSSLQHFWSLAVEEQCFWAMPPILALCGLGIDRLRGARRAARRVLQRRLVLGSAVALGLIPVLFHLDPDTVYYGTHIRGSEFLVGVWLGLWLAPGVDGEPMAERMRLLRIAGPVGLAILAVVMLTLDRNLAWLYRGGLGLFAIPAAAAVGGAFASAPGLRQVLSLPVFRLPGRWALSVYALHWPLFQVLDHWLPDVGQSILVPIKFAVAMVVGGLTYRWFERPLSINSRSRNVRPAPVGRRRLVGALGSASWSWGRDRLALGALGSVAVLLVLVAATVHRPTPEIDFAAALRSQEQALPAGPPDPSPPDPVPLGPEAVPVPAPITAPVTGALEAATRPERVGVYGSSSGLLLGYTIGSWLRPHPGWSDVGGSTELGCGFVFEGSRLEPVSDQPGGELVRPGPKCDWRTEWSAKLARSRPTMVIVIPGRWEASDWVLDGADSDTNLENPAFQDLVRTRMAAALDLIHDHGTSRIVLTTVPQTGPGRSGTLVEDRKFPGDEPRRIDRLNDLLRQVAAQRPWIRMVDLAAWADGLPRDRHGELFPDGVHTNEENGPIVWSEFLGPAIDDLDWEG